MCDYGCACQQRRDEIDLPLTEAEETAVDGYIVGLAAESPEYFGMETVVQAARKGKHFHHDVTEGESDSSQPSRGGAAYPGTAAGGLHTNVLDKVMEITKMYPNLFQRPAPLGHASTPSKPGPYRAPAGRPQRHY